MRLFETVVYIAVVAFIACFLGWHLNRAIRDVKTPFYLIGQQIENFGKAQLEAR